MTHQLLPSALYYKHPGVPGISTKDGELIAWPASLGAWPTDAQLTAWIAEYQAYKGSAAEKDTELQTFLDTAGGKALKALATVLIQKGVLTLAEIRAVYRSLA